MNQMLLRVPREETSLRQRATQTLRQAILDGHFTPGQKMSERELCESLDVSRSCVRESLQHLQAEGLITIIPHRGPEVTTISPKEVRDIYEVRAHLESLAGRGFALNASQDQVRALRAKLTELSQPGITQDRALMLNVKNQFYDILIAGCGNLVAGQLLQQLNNRVTVLRRISMAQPGRFPHTLVELDAIVAAIEQGDGETAARLCEEHVRKAAANVLQSMQPAEAKLRA
jgi:DNA-binding GntR family transcriptional regulator